MQLSLNCLDWIPALDKLHFNGEEKESESCMRFTFQLDGVHFFHTTIRELVDSPCRDGTDTPTPPYIGKAFTCSNIGDLSLCSYMIMFCK